MIDSFGAPPAPVADRDPETREPTVEVAHEALLHEWDRLHAWIEGAREDLRVSARISAAAREWTQADRSADYLLAGVRLAQSEEATRDDSIRLTVTEREYLDASVARRDAQVEAERERHARELTLERRARIRLRSLVAVLAAAPVLAASLTVVSVNRDREAERQRAESTIAALTSGALSNLNTDPQLSALLALHAVSLTASLDQPVPTETVESLHWAMHEAGVEYPVAEGPTAIAAGPLGIRGVVDLPVPALWEATRDDVSRPLTPAECERYLGSSSCPTLPATLPEDLETQGDRSGGRRLRASPCPARRSPCSAGTIRTRWPSSSESSGRSP